MARWKLFIPDSAIPTYSRNNAFGGVFRYLQSASPCELIYYAESFYRPGFIYGSAPQNISWH